MEGQQSINGRTTEEQRKPCKTQQKNNGRTTEHQRKPDTTQRKNNGNHAKQYGTSPKNGHHDNRTEPELSAAGVHEFRRSLGNPNIKVIKNALGLKVSVKRS